MDLFDKLKKSSQAGKGDAKKRKSSLEDIKSSKSKDSKSGHSPKKHGSGSKSEHSPKKHDGKGKSNLSKSHDHNKSLNSSKHQSDENSSKHSSKKHSGKTDHTPKTPDQKSGSASKNQGSKGGNSIKSNDKKLAKFNDKHKSYNSSIRRESMPSPVSPQFLASRSKGKKSRSLSPPKANAVLKSLKVKVERKNLSDYLKSPINAHANNIKSKNDKSKDARESKQKSPLKATPTKAQKKLFEPVRSRKSKAQILRDFNIKKCAVRIRRDNFKKLMQELKKKKANTKIQSKSPGTKSAGRPRKRPLPNDEEEAPPAKKGKVPPLKVKTNFFIKISTPKLEKKIKPMSKTSPTTSSVAHHNKIKNSKSLGITTPTKFSRTHLIRSFGKRFFTSFVRIEKCTHPLLLTFESNDRARRLQTKRNKSKNLSVSFREQVEVFGGSSDSDSSYDDNFCVVPQPSNRNGRRANAPSVPLAIVPATPVVMPARLKKVENGKVVDDIELDPSLFLDPKNLVASTPYSPGRKRRDHKSFSPLKDEGSPSPRKEQLKLANEKIPPSGLRRLNIDEEDDEDDDCEYIVPIELPQRRTSRASSTNTLDGGPSLFPPALPAESVLPITPDDCPIIPDTDKDIETNQTVSPNATETAAIDLIEALPTVTESPPPTIAEASSPTPIVSTSPPPPIENVATTPIPEIPDIPDIPDDPESEDNNPVTNTDIPVGGSGASTEEEPPQTNNACNNEDDNNSNETFHSAGQNVALPPQANGNDNNNDAENRPTSLSPTSALNDVFDAVAASVIESACETQPTQDATEINGTAAGILKNDLGVDDGMNDMSMNLFIEDDSQADGDSPEKSFVDSIINETLDKLSKDIEEGSPVDEQYTQNAT